MPRKMWFFNYQSDQLITLGDICDGYPDLDLCIDLLIDLPNCINVKGNHDEWTHQDLIDRTLDEAHATQGGVGTLSNYIDENGNWDELKILHHLTCFFDKQKYYHLENGNCFVHGGIDLNLTMIEQNNANMMWQRGLTSYALYLQSNNLKKTHTSDSQEYIYWPYSNHKF